jgi:ribosomal protein S18 acetylase RimI-like enzyme
MEPRIIPATHADLNIILRLFERAIQYQKENNYIGWKSMDGKFIETDIQQGLLYKVLSEDRILGIFCVCFIDKLIWRDKENGDAIYLHRIVLNREYAGVKIFRTVLHWAIKYAKKNSLKYVRMDTWAENTKLIGYYKNYGFRFIENYTTENTRDLPVQHRNLNVALLEFEIA